MKSTNTDILLHAISLQIAAAYHRISSENKDGEFAATLYDLIIAYRNVRRGISKNEKGDRYGASAAHHVLSMGEIL